MNLKKSRTIDNIVLEFDSEYRGSFLIDVQRQIDIEPFSEIKSLHYDNDRTQTLLDLANKNKDLYGELVDKYEDGIDQNNQRIRELRDEVLSVEGGPQRPKRYFGDPKGAFSIAEAINKIYDNLEKGTYDEISLTKKLKEIGRLIDKYRDPERKRIYEGPGVSTFGNYEVELDIPDLHFRVLIVERYDFGGHGRTGKRTPHVQYDLVFRGLKPGTLPRPLGSGTKDFVHLSESQEEFGYRIEGTGKERKITYFNLQK